MLKALRRMRRVTQQQLADRVSLSRTSICNIEQGRQTITDRTLVEIADALGFEVRVQFRPKRPGG